MKRIVQALLALCIATAIPAAAETVRLASDVWPPFTDVPGQPRIAIELVEQALQRAGHDMKNRIVGFDAVLEGLDSGTYDGSAAFWHNDEREQYLLYSRAYLENRLILVGRKGADVDVATLAELAGKRVAVVEGYAYGEDVADGAGPVFVAGHSDQQNLRLLLQDEVDYMLVDELLMQYVLSYQAEEARANLEIGTTALIRKTLHLAVSKEFAGAQELIDRFNDEIHKMLADGSYNRILGLSWIRADIDGDGRLELVLGDQAGGTAAPSDTYEIAAADSGSTGQSDYDRYWIQGRAYDSWDDVPERYKYEAPGKKDNQDPGMNLFRLEF